MDGRLTPIKNAASAGNASRNRKVGTTRALARAVHGALDRRFALAKVIEGYAGEYRAHVGDDAAAAPLLHLCESAARHRVIANVAFADLMTRGVFNAEGNARASFEVWRRADSDLRACLQVLGLERRAKAVPTLADILQGSDAR